MSFVVGSGPLSSKTAKRLPLFKLRQKGAPTKRPVIKGFGLKHLIAEHSANEGLPTQPLGHKRSQATKGPPTKRPFRLLHYKSIKCTVKRIPNIYSQNPNSATSLPNTQFIFPKQIFIILCGPSLPMRPNARVLALISVMPKFLSAVYQQLDCQIHTAEQLLPGQAA